jgi:dihydroneopterin aldolase
MNIYFSVKKNHNKIEIGFTDENRKKLFIQSVDANFSIDEINQIKNWLNYRHNAKLLTVTLEEKNTFDLLLGNSLPYGCHTKIFNNFFKIKKITLGNLVFKRLNFHENNALNDSTVNYFICEKSIFMI